MGKPICTCLPGTTGTGEKQFEAPTGIAINKTTGAVYAADSDEAILGTNRWRILHQITVGRRNRAYEAPEIIDAFTDLERQLASPAGDTRSSPPSQPTPTRRRAQTA